MDRFPGEVEDGQRRGNRVDQREGTLNDAIWIMKEEALYD